MSSNYPTKGTKGFIPLNKPLGETITKRIPLSISNEIQSIITHLERIASTKGIDKVETILDNIISGLENVPH
jgi:hypothetical protein